MMHITLAPKSQLKINQLAESGTDQEPRLPAEDALHANDILRLYERDARSFDLLSAEEEIALERRMEEAEEATQKLEQKWLDEDRTRQLEAQIRKGEEAEQRFIKCNLLPFHAVEKIKRLRRLQWRWVRSKGRQPTIRELAANSNLLSPQNAWSIRSALDADGELPSDLEKKVKRVEEEVRHLLQISARSV